MNKWTDNCVARVLNTNVEQIISIYRTNKTNTSKQPKFFTSIFDRMDWVSAN